VIKTGGLIIPQVKGSQSYQRASFLLNLIGEKIMIELRLNKELVTIIDEDMYEQLMQYRWGFDGRYVYARSVATGGKKIYMQRIVNKTPKGFDTDHINGDKLDNRKANLRSVTRSQNNMNQKKQDGRSSQYKGVCWHKQRSKWKAEIKLNGKRKHLGVFVCEHEAAKAYNNAAKERFGEFARLNTNNGE
jgi:hypothetical protein